MLKLKVMTKFENKNMINGTTIKNDKYEIKNDKSSIT